MRRASESARRADGLLGRGGVAAWRVTRSRRGGRPARRAYRLRRPRCPRAGFTGREAFRQLVRDALACAAREGWREMVVCDASFEDWPLGEREVVASLQGWARSGRRFVMVARRLRPGHRAARPVCRLAQDLEPPHRMPRLPGGRPAGVAQRALEPGLDAAPPGCRALHRRHQPDAPRRVSAARNAGRMDAAQHTGFPGDHPRALAAKFRLERPDNLLRPAKIRVCMGCTWKGYTARLNERARVLSLGHCNASCNDTFRKLFSPPH